MKTILPILLLVASSLVARAAPPPPANDNFADRISLVASGSISVKGVNAKATTEAGEPTINGDVVYKSVWWSWTAPFSGPATITTTGSSFDTLLGVFIGTTLTGLSTIAENDDAGSLYTSSVTFNAVGGVPYVILVGGYNNAGGKVTLNVQVAAGPCAYIITPSSRSVAYTSGTSSVAVSTTTGCTWSSTSNDSWIVVTGGSSGTGSGTTTYSIAANTDLTPRTGTLTVAGLTHTVIQSAAPACTYSITPVAAAFTASPNTNSFTMAAGTGCAWTAVPNASWLTIQSGSSGTGNGTTTYVVATNALSNTRIGTITVAGQTHTVTQTGTVPCSYSIAPTTAPFAASGGTSNIVVSTLTDCAWTASSPASWVTFGTTNGVGNGTVTYTVAANATTVARSTVLTVAGNSFTVTQSAAACSYALTPTTVSVAASASSGSVSMITTTGCAWSSAANVTWLTITSGVTGTGNGTVGYSVAANPNTTIRAGTLTIGGQTFTVNQAAAACIYTLDLTAAHYSEASGTGSIAVTAGTGCAWTAVSNDGFITVNSGTPGSGSGTVGYTVAANGTASSRTGTITVAGSTFTITQDGTAPCTYGITPSSASVTYSGITNTVAVAANTGCVWSASSGATWITLSPASGSGNGTVTYVVAANASSLSRNGTLTIAGNPFTVTQTGAPCIYSITPTTASYTYVGGSGTVTVTATSNCSWTTFSDSSWLTVTAGATGVGNGTVTYLVAATSATTNRTGRLTIAGRTLNVTQTGQPCTAVLSPLSATIPATGGSGSIILTESDPSCAWTAVDNQTWISVSPASGTGDASISYTVLPTNQSATRNATVTVSGQLFAISQTGDTTVPVVSLIAPANGSTVSNVITLTATATDDVSVSRVDFFYDNAILIGSDLTSPYNIPLNTTNLSNAAHTFYARGFDPANNQGTSTTNSVTISNSSPSTNFWVQGFGGVGIDVGTATAVDSAGNVIAVGYYSTPTIDFGGGSITNAGGSDIFVAKFSASGAYQWAKRFGGAQNDQAISVAVDAADNVIVTGTFMGTVNFGDGNVTSTFSGSGATTTTDAFVLKLNSSGVFVWKRKWDNNAFNRAKGIAIDASSNVLFCGSFTGSTSLADDGFATFYTSAGSFDIVLGKLDGTTGALIWGKRLGGTLSDEPMAVAADAGTGDMLVTGYFDSTMDFGGGSVATTGSDQIFLARYGAAAGVYGWSKTFPVIGRGQGVAVDSSGNVLFTGQFRGTVNLGTGNLVSGAGTSDIFIAKYNGAGTTTAWTKKGGSSTSGDSAGGIAIDTSSNVIITGTFPGTGTFDSSSITSAGMTDVYVTKYSSAGVLQWARGYGGIQTDNGLSAVVNANGVYATGSFQGSAFFNGITLPGHGSGDTDIYLMRIVP